MKETTRQVIERYGIHGFYPEPRELSEGMILLSKPKERWSIFIGPDTTLEEAEESIENYEAHKQYLNSVSQSKII